MPLLTTARPSDSRPKRDHLLSEPRRCPDRKGRHGGRLADINQATALDPEYTYTALWLDIVAHRSNVPSRLSAATEKLEMTGWPAPLVRLYLGQTSPERVLAAAEGSKSKTCDANFYAGEFSNRNGQKDEATRLFKLAVTAASTPRTNGSPQMPN